MVNWKLRYIAKCGILALKVFAQNKEPLVLELIFTLVITSFVFQHQLRHFLKEYKHLRSLKIVQMSPPHKVANINILNGYGMRFVK